MRLAIVEDDLQLLQNLELLLNGEPGIDVVGVFVTAEDALNGLSICQPDVLLSDIGLPGLSGVELIGRLKQDMPNVDVMVYTVSDDSQTVFAALKAGASGYITKGARPRELIEALVELHGGGSPMSPRIARSVIESFHDERLHREDSVLTRKELDVLQEIERGASYKETARTLAISPHTVHSHIKRIYEKLQAKSRAQALAAARRQGLI
jgi:DNA-binding NarL/FixJ family response regulator